MDEVEREMSDGRIERPVLADRGDLEHPGALRRAASEVGALAARGAEEPVESLRRLASPEVLDVLFRVALGTSLRRGPAGAPEVGSPARLVELAAVAARRGALPMASVAALRGALDALAEELRETGAWAADAPLWWSPLPAPDGLETLWRELGGAGAREAPAVVPPADRVREAFDGGRSGGASRWLAWPGALPAHLLERVAAELAASSAAGVLSLAGGGVGSSDRRSSRRSDLVRYLTGLEPELLSRAPTLALLVQHLLDRTEAPLRRLLPSLEIHAPQTVMLARFRPPSGGFAPHLDNPGGEVDNGRLLTLILYLNPSERPCQGGGLALWADGSSVEDPPAAVVAPTGGSAVLFDSRAVPHSVEPLDPGPDRWTLVLWLSDRPRRAARPLVTVPEATAAEAVLPVDDPPVAPGAVLFRSLGPGGVGAGISVHRPEPGRQPQAGVVATVRGAGPHLEGWCRHHLDLGFDRLLVVLDDGAGREESADLADLQETLGRERLAVWTPEEAGRRRHGLPRFEGYDALVAAAAHGTATWAVAARQALNATAAARAARTGSWDGGDPGALDWLVHLDADELFHLEGAGRGGSTVAEHFAAAEAAGWRAVRYLNHELLLPWRPGEPARFKRNPALAAQRLGPAGWRHLARHLAMEQGDRRPYFRAYWNGKAAVAVAPGVRAAGVHGWHVPDGTAEPCLAGPAILHVHLPTAEAFRRKYLLAAEAGGGPDAGARPFPPSPLEQAAVSLVQELRRSGATPETVAAHLDALYADTTTFAPEEIELLEDAGLVFDPGVRRAVVPRGEVTA